MSENDDFLLFALSAWREASWVRFKELFGNLYLRQVNIENEPEEPISRYRTRTLQALGLLGHVDVHFDSSSTGRVFVAPSLLARLPTRGFPQAVLCGSRGPQTITLLADYCQEYGCELHVEAQSQNDKLFTPRRVVIEAESTTLLDRIADALHVRFAAVPPAWSLLDLAPDLDTYLRSFTWSPPQEINWLRQDFSADSLTFLQPNEYNHDFPRLSRYQDPVRSTYRYYLWDREGRVQVDPAWGRYATLRAEGRHVIVYDCIKATLAVPSGTPLPDLLGRSATLCTGQVPLSVHGPVLDAGLPEATRYDVFRGVPLDMAQALASKVGQILVKQTVPVG